MTSFVNSAMVISARAYRLGHLNLIANLGFWPKINHGFLTTVNILTKYCLFGRSAQNVA